MDILLATLLLLLTLPVLVFTAILLAIQNNGSIFFIQERPGERETLFRILKFKTMSDKTDEMGNQLPDNVRLTRLGRAIRKLSIDELPQLFNVLMGSMSLIGPRPLLVRYLPLYNEEQRRRHEVKPGITGWAQVNGRNSISWKNKFELDIYYVDNLSFILDLKILILTIKKVVKKEGVNQSDSRPMLPFNGSN